MLRRCIRKHLLLGSPLEVANFFPNNLKKFSASFAQIPIVSTAIGRTIKSRDNCLYFECFFVSAAFAIIPGPCEAKLVWLGAKVSEQVKSHTRHLPWLQGKAVQPSGLLPSDLDKPAGSRVLAILAEQSARCTILFTS